MLEVLCLRDALPYSCLFLRGVICCWSIPAANYSNPCASSTCIWELEEAGEWGTEGFGLCLTICLVKHWYYLVSFPPTLQCMMQGKLRWLWSFIVLTVLSVKHNSICSFLLILATIQEFLKHNDQTLLQWKPICIRKPVYGSILSTSKASQRRNAEYFLLYLCSIPNAK